LTSIVYAGFPSGATIAPEHIIREMFSSCGEVLEIYIHQTQKQNSAKSYALIEMATPVSSQFPFNAGLLHSKKLYGFIKLLKSSFPVEILS